MSVLSTYAPKVEHRTISDPLERLEYTKTYELERWVLKYWKVLTCLAFRPQYLKELIKNTKLRRNTVSRMIRKFEKAGIVHTKRENRKGVGRVTLVELDNSFIDSVIKGENPTRDDVQKAYYKLRGYLKRRARERYRRSNVLVPFNRVYPYVFGMEVKEFFSR